MVEQNVDDHLLVVRETVLMKFYLLVELFYHVNLSDIEKGIIHLEQLGNIMEKSKNFMCSNICSNMCLTI